MSSAPPNIDESLPPAEGTGKPSPTKRSRIPQRNIPSHAGSTSRQSPHPVGTDPSSSQALASPQQRDAMLPNVPSKIPRRPKTPSKASVRTSHQSKSASDGVGATQSGLPKAPARGAPVTPTVKSPWGPVRCFDPITGLSN